MPPVTDDNRAAVKEFRRLAIEVKNSCEPMISMLNYVDLHIDADNTLPGAGNEADFLDVYNAFIDDYRTHRAAIVAALAELPDL